MAAAVASGTPDLVAAPEAETPRKAPTWLTAVPPVDAGPEYAEWAELYSLYRRMNADEREIVMHVAKKTLGKGRTEYGPAHIEDDRDDVVEIAGEIDDAIWYAAKLCQRLERLRGK